MFQHIPFQFYCYKVSEEFGFKNAARATVENAARAIVSNMWRELLSQEATCANMTR